ncbi:cupin domain-containing protein [Cohnella sp. JJ-181]|uniref:cupin domain-containing protein n=1 Tax=Cohnella rhizoplanae TaxID=2974897 RepID=UPI0022FF6186|nr:cupin domain-containing protein [Cohnella sp. JJ-181]CAI6025068.1 hypothetical protein COHCIP112018_00471 [Cohnella sp. JJ-181]
MSLIKPFVKTPSTMEGYDEDGVTFLEVEEAETLNSNYVRIGPGQSSNAAYGYHDDEEELYFIVGGAADLTLGEASYEVKSGDVVYIPRNTFHQVTCTSEVDFEYFCVANFPDHPPKLKPIHRKE